MTPCVLLFSLGSASAAEIVVPSADHATVQSAVSASSDGDTIIVTQSLDGQVDINNRDLVLQGLGLSVVLTAGLEPVVEVRGSSQVTIRHLTIDGEDSRRAVEVGGSADATLEAVKVMRGREEGGGILADDTAELLVTGSLVCGCQALSGGDHGGGLRATSVSRVDIVDSVFFANDANARGGAVRFEEPGTISGSTFYSNTAARAAAISANDPATVVDLSTSIVWANENRVVKKSPAVVDGSSGGSFTGADNAYFDNDPSDTDTPLGGDTFGTDPELVTLTPDCLIATMADFTAVAGGFAATSGLGAVGSDGDTDGYGLGPDCNDTDDLIHPGAIEEPADGVDQNCDGVELCYVDSDDDGQGDPNATIWTTQLDCMGHGIAPTADDCDDTDGSVYSGAPEIVGDGIDQDCFGGDVCFADLDGDDYTSGMLIPNEDADCDDAGEAGPGTPDGDCDDNEATVNPGVLYDTVGDGVDADCDDIETCYVDSDSDGFSDRSETMTSVPGDCTGPEEGGITIDDCDDTDPNTFPGAPEQCDKRDNDCDMDIDEDVLPVDWYPDTDGDYFGDLYATPVNDCLAPPDHVGNNDDCDDGAPAINPGVPEQPCDGIDNDCNATTYDDDGSCYGGTGDTGEGDTGDTGEGDTGEGDTGVRGDTGEGDTGDASETGNQGDTALQTTDTTGGPRVAEPGVVAQQGCACSSETVARPWALLHAFGRRRASTGVADPAPEG